MPDFLLTLVILSGLLLTAIVVLHLVFKAPRLQTNRTPRHYGMDYQTHIIPTEKGKSLSSWFIQNNPTAPTLVILHGWGGNAALMLPLALPFYLHGFNIVLFDARNHGHSDSDTYSSMPRFAEDLHHIIAWTKQRTSESILLLGHSVGAAAVLLEASRRKDISAVISIATFAHPQWLMRRYLQKFHLPRVIIRVILRYIEWVIGYRFAAIAPLHTLCRIPCPVLLVHGTRDNTIPVSDAHILKKQCPDSSVELLLIEGADHDSVEMVEQYGTLLLNFLERHHVCKSEY